MAGPPGAGKSTLAMAVARRLRWPIVDKDTIKSRLLNAGIAEEIAGPASYDLMFDLGKDLLLEQRLSVILDSPAGYPIVIERAHALARQAEANLKFVLCLADPSTLTERLSRRTARQSQWSVNEVGEEDTRQRWMSLLPPDSLVLDMAQTTDHLLQSVVPYLIASPPSNSGDA